MRGEALHGQMEVQLQQFCFREVLPDIPVELLVRQWLRIRSRGQATTCLRASRKREGGQ